MRAAIAMILVAAAVQLAVAEPAAKPKPPSCDAEGLTTQGKNALNTGTYSAALKYFEQSLACKLDDKLYPLCLMAACKGGMEAKARLYYKKLSASQQDRLRQMCTANHIDPTKD